jgi:hypothetical protein
VGATVGWAGERPPLIAPRAVNALIVHARKQGGAIRRLIE